MVMEPEDWALVSERFLFRCGMRNYSKSGQQYLVTSVCFWLVLGHEIERERERERERVYLT